MLTRMWAHMRGFIDRFLEYDPSPPVGVENGDYKIIVSDSLPPEANAMALAMYSRSPRSFLLHYEEVLRKGWKKFLSQFYVGYGHKSIGDCGSTTICIENVSMLCAKAIQQYLLYKGQEASTRYLDMSGQRLVDPIGSIESSNINRRWMSLYEKVLARLIVHLKGKFPRKDGENETTWEKAIKARAFDIARSFLPASVSTYVGWHTTLREAADHLLELRHHPLPEVRDVAETMSLALHQKYPSSGFDKRYPETEAYVEKWMMEYAYMEPVDSPLGPFMVGHNINLNATNFKYETVLESRPAKTELPKFMKKLGNMRFQFLLDFGSFRDLQRHRSGTILMPPLTVNYGFHEWYLAELPEDLRIEAQAEIQALLEKVRGLYCTEEARQYYMAMGFKVHCECTLDLPAATYIAELRSKQDVHPTLRVVAQKIGATLRELFPAMKLYCDTDPDKWSVSRGKHDIVRKN